LQSSHPFAVLLTVDGGMFAPALFTAHSVLRRAPKTPFDLVIAVPQNSVPRAWIDYAEMHIGVTVSEIAFDRHLSVTSTGNRNLPPSALYRYFFDRVLGPRYRKVIYLDADMRVDGDISALFDLDCEGHPFAATPDGMISSDASGQWRAYLARLGLDETVCYANTGLLVIDPERWAAQEVSARLLDYLGRHAEACTLVDQSALNAVVRGSFQKLSPVWNMLSGIWFASDIADTIHPVVFHYSGASKPWRPLTWPYDPAVTELYRDFFRSLPWPAAVNWSGDFADWRQFLRFRRRAVLRRLRGRPAVKPVADETMMKFRQFVRNEPFADVRQGIVQWQADGSLGAA